MLRPFSLLEKFLEMKAIDLNAVCILFHVPIVFVGGVGKGMLQTRGFAVQYIQC